MKEEQQYPKEIIETIEKLFPKGKDKRRGDALVLQAVAFNEGRRFGEIKTKREIHEILRKKIYNFDNHEGVEELFMEENSK